MLVRGSAAKSGIGDGALESLPCVVLARLRCCALGSSKVANGWFCSVVVDELPVDRDSKGAKSSGLAATGISILLVLGFGALPILIACRALFEE